MAKVKDLVIDDKTNTLKLYFNSFKDYENIKSLISNLLFFAQEPDNETPPLFIARISDKHKLIAVRDSEHAAQKGQGIIDCLQKLSLNDVLPAAKLAAINLNATSSKPEKMLKIIKNSA